MTTTLRQVLNHFEQSEGAVSLPQLARTLGVERDTLQNMIDFWVRKGKLRESSAPVCSTCGSSSGCPFVVALPRCYERVREGDAEAKPALQSGGCGCGHCG